MVVESVVAQVGVAVVDTVLARPLVVKLVVAVCVSLLTAFVLVLSCG